MGAGSMKQDIAVLRRVMSFFWTRDGTLMKRRIMMALTAMITAKLIVAGLPVTYKTIIDDFTHGSEGGGNTVDLVLLLIAIYALGRLVSVVLIQFRDVAFVSVLHQARRAIATDVFRRILAVDYSFFLNNKVGEVQQKVDRGVRSVSSLTDYLLFNMLPTMFEILVSSVAIAIFLSPWHALVIVGSAVLYVLFTVWVTEWRLSHRKAMNTAENTAKGVAVDAIMNAEIIKLHSAEHHEVQRYAHALRQYEDASVVSARGLALVNMGQAAIIALVLLVELLTVGMGVLDGSSTIGQFSMVNIYLLQVFTPLGMLGFVYRQIRFSLTDLSGMFEMVDSKLPDETDEKPPSSAHGRPASDVGPVLPIVFENVSFGFGEEGKQILSHVNLRIEPGKVQGVVGTTGAGKSTLLRLLFGLYTPQEGQILINGVPLPDIDVASYRQRLAIVPQDTILFHDSLRNNIAYGLDDARDDDIMAAARAAEISDELLSGPHDLDRTVGERGGSISGGQRQRVALARALLRKPSVLVLDEPTSALDEKTGRQVMERVYALAREQGTAVIIVTHDMSNVADADELVRVEDGSVSAVHR